MTLDEAIQHCKDEAHVLFQHSAKHRTGTEDSCYECAKEHEQLAEWLTELKQRREACMMIDSETLKARIGELCLNNDDMFSARAYERIIGVIEAVPTEPKVNRAEILRMCNDIEDEVTDIAFNSTHYHIRDCCESIREYLQAIGKELKGDAGSKID